MIVFVEETRDTRQAAACMKAGQLYFFSFRGLRQPNRDYRNMIMIDFALFAAC